MLMSNEMTIEEKWRGLPSTVRYSLRGSGLTSLKASASVTMNEREVDKLLAENEVTDVQERIAAKLALQAAGIMVCGAAPRIAG
jgi:hypothetical protein